MLNPYARRFWGVLALLTVGLAACDDDGSTTQVEPVNEAEVLVQYLEAKADYDIHGGFVIKAADVRTNLVSGADQYVIDMRSATDFAKGHIEGAVNVPFDQIDDHLASLGAQADGYEVIVFVCYSGQTAAYATGVARALGYSNVKSMKWGMASWHTDFSGSWVNNRANAGATQFVTGASPAKNGEGPLPELNTGFDDGPSILAARGQALTSEGFGPAKITNADVLANPDNYYVVNYWPPALYQDIGHIDGAVNYDPATKPFNTSTFLKTLPADETIVLYCYTGQTSAYLTGYLRTLGYDARSLLFGTNGMIYDKMVAEGVANPFDPSHDIMDYSYVK